MIDKTEWPIESECHGLALASVAFDERECVDISEFMVL